MSSGAITWDLLFAQFPLVKYIVFGTVASSGALTRFLWDTMRSSIPFTFSGILLYCVFGFFIGNLTGAFIGLDFAYRDGVLLLSGFVVRELFDVLHKRGAGTISKLLKLTKDSEEKTKEES